MINPSNSNSKYHQGYFMPFYKEKYVGDINNIKFRSGWERICMVLLDKSNQVKKWSSEPIAIDYISPVDSKHHKYFVDFFVQWSNGKKSLIEVKPYHQTLKPRLNESKKSKKSIDSYVYEVKMYLTNLAKWKFAEEFCNKIPDWNFLVWTEKDIPNLK